MNNVERGYKVSGDSNNCRGCVAKGDDGKCSMDNKPIKLVDHCYGKVIPVAENVDELRRALDYINAVRSEKIQDRNGYTLRGTSINGDPDNCVGCGLYQGQNGEGPKCLERDLFVEDINDCSTGRITFWGNSADPSLVHRVVTSTESILRREGER